MIILQVTPLSQNIWVAGLEAIVLMALAAYIGWWIARRTFVTNLEALHSDIHNRRQELNDCMKSKSSGALSAVPTIAAAVPVVEAAPMPVIAVVPDDLKIIEGIGPKIEELLNNEGILTFGQLASSTPERIKDILNAAGPRFQIHDPATWPQQSAMARDGKWDELKAWQDELNKGRLE
jgi:predicted flap endonuclease-1-like 5' DNA nuclease